MVCAAVFLGASCDCFAQSRSGKRSNVKIRAHSVVRHIGEPVEAKEFDVRIGDIVAVEGQKAVVKIKSHQIFPAWRQIYYACDERYNAVAILSRMGEHTNKSCTLFEVISGSARAGDTVFLKQIPPEIPE
ncbi:MAG: hypothetical protein IKO42_04485 [Opitutales bacterium]|nr:hypothetical protein [Opitutales bacterium]